jgi:hypothetical protein
MHLRVRITIKRPMNLVYDLLNESHHFEKCTGEIERQLRGIQFRLSTVQLLTRQSRMSAPDAHSQMQSFAAASRQAMRRK